MKIRTQLKEITSFSKGEQINGDNLIIDGQYDYLNGGIAPSGRWNDYNTPGGTVTISEGGNSCGFVNYMQEPFWCGAHCYYLYDTILNSEYLYYVLKSQQTHLMKSRTGACMPNIKKTDLGKFEITYDTDEKTQLLTVNVLKKIENTIFNRKQELLKLDTLIKARFVEMFGDPKYNPHGYDVRELRGTCDVITGNTPSRAVKGYYGDYIEWIKTDNIVSGRTNPTIASEYLSEEGMAVGRTVNEGAVLMACIAGSVASIGKVCITNRKVAFNQQINAIVPKDYDIRFLYVLLQISKSYLVEELNMALKGILSKSKLEEKTFYVPPLNDQKKFATFAAQVDKSKVVVQKALDETQLLFDSLMQKYFG